MLVSRKVPPTGCTRAATVLRFSLLGALALIVSQTPAASAWAQRADDTFFELKIRPVLLGKCFKCHGDKKVSHGLRVDSRAALLKGGDNGPAVAPGDPDKSLLIQALRYSHAEIKMPPDKQLPDAVVTDFATWIKQGAVWPQTQSR